MVERPRSVVLCRKGHECAAHAHCDAELSRAEDARDVTALLPKGTLEDSQFSDTCFVLFDQTVVY